jgi:hypothetical protein
VDLPSFDRRRGECPHGPIKTLSKHNTHMMDFHSYFDRFLMHGVLCRVVLQFSRESRSRVGGPTVSEVYTASPNNLPMNRI